MTEYFIRYSDSKKWLENDLERGYSFHSYQFESSAEALLGESPEFRIWTVQEYSDTMRALRETE